MEQVIEDVLEKQNLWWFGKSYGTGIHRLHYYPRLSRYLDTEEILLVLGARRTGKSTLLYQLIRSLELPEDEVPDGLLSEEAVMGSECSIR